MRLGDRQFCGHHSGANGGSADWGPSLGGHGWAAEARRARQARHHGARLAVVPGGAVGGRPGEARAVAVLPHQAGQAGVGGGAAAGGVEGPHGTCRP